MADDTQRTCVGCGEIRPADHLERFVHVQDIGLLFDLRRKAPGRGAWVCPNADCLQKAISRGFARSFKTRIEAPSPEALRDSMEEGILQRMTENLRVAVRAKKGFVGSRAVEDGMKNGLIRLVMLACDAGGATEKKFRSNAERKELPTINKLDGVFLGNASGRDFVSVFGIGGPLASRIQADFRSLEGLGVFEG